MSAPVRTLNAATTQYIAVILILVCVFVMLSEEAKSKISALRPAPVRHLVQTEQIQIEPIKKRIILTQPVSTRNLMVRGEFDDAAHHKITAVMSMLGNHDLGAEFEISGRPVEISMIVAELHKFSLPADASRFILKPDKNSVETTLAIRVVQPSKKRTIRSAT